MPHAYINALCIFLYAQVELYIELIYIEETYISLI